MKYKVLKTFLASLIIAASSFANAALVVDLTIDEDEWGVIKFDWTGGEITINGLAKDWAGGSTGYGLWDSYFSLFENDGSQLNSFTGEHIRNNDDSVVSGWDADGSTSGLDSMIRQTLSSGSYILFIGDEGGNFESVRDISEFSDSDGGDIRITFSDGASLQKVSEPYTVAIFLLGLFGIVLRRINQ